MAQALFLGTIASLTGFLLCHEACRDCAEQTDWHKVHGTVIRFMTQDMARPPVSGVPVSYILPLRKKKRKCSFALGAGCILIAQLLTHADITSVTMFVSELCRGRQWYCPGCPGNSV